MKRWEGEGPSPKYFGLEPPLGTQQQMRAASCREPTDEEDLLFTFGSRRSWLIPVSVVRECRSVLADLYYTRTHHRHRLPMASYATGWVAGRASGLYKKTKSGGVSVWSEVQTCIWPS